MTSPRTLAPAKASSSTRAYFGPFPRPTASIAIPVYLATARRAFEYLCAAFWDNEFGGLYWMVDFEGHPSDTKKRIYGQAFTIYALAEYYHASGAPEALLRAMRLVDQIESWATTPPMAATLRPMNGTGGLPETSGLSEVDMDEKKSMNTHLHMLEAYATLLGVHEDSTVRNRLRELIEMFLSTLSTQTLSHFILFFDELWKPRSEVISFGHDIEGSWLLCEAADRLGDRAVIKIVEAASVKMAQAVYDQAIDADGGLLYEAEGGRIINTDKHWWPQSEAVVGFLNAWQLTGQPHFLHAAERSWEFIDKYIVDHRNGEWFWRVSRDGDSQSRRRQGGTVEVSLPQQPHML
jgi:mannobiose 2-epimerase